MALPKLENQAIARIDSVAELSTCASRRIDAFTERDLQTAYLHSRSVTRDASKTFYLAARLLPPPKRQAIEALYAFARTMDDIVDEHPNASKALADKLAQMGTISAMQDPVLRAWNDTCTRYAIPGQLVDDLIAGITMDLEPRRYASLMDLKLYCYRVASVIGLVSMHIIGHTPGAEPYAIQLGYALQLTNILRDIGEDAARGRLYLPLEDLERFGVRETDIFNGVRNAQFRALMQWEIQRAEQFYRSGWPGIRLLHRDGQFAVTAAILLYRSILGKIITNDYDVFNRRAALSFKEKFLMLPHIRIQLMALRRGQTQLPSARLDYVGKSPR